MTPLFQRCSQDPLVTQHLGTAPTRLYPFGEAPDNVELPYAVYQTVSGNSYSYLAQRPDTDRIRLQIDVYAATVAAAEQTRAALLHAIEPEAALMAYNGDGTDETTGHRRTSFDIEWIVPR